jgi:copper chaperone CopZ
MKKNSRGEMMKEETIDVKGMHCKSCAELIETKLSQVKGIDKIRVSLVEEKAYVRFDSKQIDLNSVKTEIKNMGYKTDIEQGSDDASKNLESSTSTEKNSIKHGIIYGIIPHTGCIAFIIATVFGVTVATQLFKPLLLNPYFFYILIAISFAFATISALFYIKRQGFITLDRAEDGLRINFSSDVIQRKWKYLSTLYGTTIGINLLLFLIVFPLLANVSLSLPSTAENAVLYGASLSSLQLKVDIPCSGHATLISGELKTINGVASVQFSLPNIFDVKYDSAKTSKQQILSLDVFKTYKATVVSESAAQASTNQQTQQLSLTNQPNNQATGGAPTAASDVQTVQLSVQGANYYPNPIRVKKGIPVQLVADMNNMPGCSRSIIIPEYGISKTVSAGDNIIQFTPDKSGTFQFSCSMGMYHGQIVVEEADGSVAAYTGSAPVTQGSCGGSGSGSSGGCGCGG